MKTIRINSFLCVAFSFTAFSSSFGQGFLNLDFENATIVHIPVQFPSDSNVVYTASAIPGWTVYGSYMGQSVMLYNTATIGSAAVSIHDLNSPFPLVLQGNYSLYLQFNSVTHAPVAIGQVGTIPNDAQSVTFFGTTSFSTLTFAGQPIPLTAIGGGPNYTVYGGDVSAFAGQTGELRFQGFGSLDNFQFSSTGIPEPTTLGLASLGLGALWWQKRQKQK
jgi:hypothetical protein